MNIFEPTFGFFRTVLNVLRRMIPRCFSNFSLRLLNQKFKFMNMNLKESSRLVIDLNEKYLIKVGFELVSYVSLWYFVTRRSRSYSIVQALTLKIHTEYLKNLVFFTYLHNLFRLLNIQKKSILELYDV